MTKPTIENATGALNELFSDVDMNKHRDAYETVRAVLETNTLPFDEIPEGWELGFISHGKFGDGATFSAQIRRIVSHTIRYAYGRTPAEALRAAIAKVTP